MPARVKVKPEGPVTYSPLSPRNLRASCAEGYSATCTSCGVLSLTGAIAHRTFYLSTAWTQARKHLREMHP